MYGVSIGDQVKLAEPCVGHNRKHLGAVGTVRSIKLPNTNNMHLTVDFPSGAVKGNYQHFQKA